MTEERFGDVEDVGDKGVSLAVLLAPEHCILIEVNVPFILVVV